MKRRYVFTMILCLLLLTPQLTVAASYEMTWSTINAGGQSAGGNYVLNGAAGQPDAGVSSGGAYTLTGGFWRMLETVQEIFHYLLWTK